MQEFAQQSFNDFRDEFPSVGHYSIEAAGYLFSLTKLHFYDRVGLLNDQDSGEITKELAHEVCIERIGHSYLEKGDLFQQAQILHYLPSVGQGHTRGHHAGLAAHPWIQQ